MKIYKLLFLTTVLLLYSPNKIPATDCRTHGTLLDEVKSSAAVFSGKVIGQEYKRITDTFDTDFGIEVLYVKLKVDRWWKGGSNAEVILRTGPTRVPGATRRSGDDFRFTTNESYLVYAGIYKGTLETSNCSRTKTLDNADEDLKVLGEGVHPKQTQGCLMTTSEPLSTVTPNRTIAINPPGIQKERDMVSVFAAMKK